MDTNPLDDQARKVEVIRYDGTEWDERGTGTRVAVWLGNCSRADRERIMRRAQVAANTGQMLRVSFPSVQTFYLAFLGGGTYGIHVLEADEAGHEDVNAAYREAVGLNDDQHNRAEHYRLVEQEARRRAHIQAAEDAAPEPTNYRGPR